jgi:hypothetical protein
MRNILLAIIALYINAGFCFGQNIKEFQSHWWQPFGGQINEIYRYKNTVYIAGAMRYIGPNNRFGGVLSVDKEMEPTLFDAKLNGDVKKAIPDQNGGWYIVGNFTSVSGVSRSGIARLNSDGTLHPWNPVINGTVNDIVFHNHIIYLGGAFSQVNGSTRYNLCALDSLGILTNWNPDANAEVKVLKVYSGKILVGGNFTGVGGQTRGRLAELDLTNGNASTWNPSCNNTVWAIETVGNKIYIGGSFTGVYGGVGNRIRLACFDYTTKGLLSFNVTADGTVRSILFDNKHLYIGGNFNNINLSSKNYFAKLDTSGAGSTAQLDIVSSQTNGVVNTISKVGAYIMVGGNLSKSNQNGILTFDTNGAYIPNLTPKVNSTNEIFTIAASGNHVFVGGDFYSIGGIISNSITVLDATTGKARTGAINTISANGSISDIEVKDSIMYIGGFFDVKVNIATVSNIVAFNMNSETFVNPNIQVGNASVYAIKADGNKLYIGGQFTTVNTLARQGFASFNLTTGNVDPLTINTTGTIREIEVSGDTIWLAGSFTNIAGTARNNIAAINKSSGVLYSWNPNINNSVNSIVVHSNLIYVGGAFTTVSGIARNRIAAIDRTTGVATSWNPNANQEVSRLRVNDNKLYINGYFTSIKSQSKSYLAAIDLTTDSLMATPTIGNRVFDIWVDNDLTLIGGYFTQVNGNLTDNLAAFLNVCRSLITKKYTSQLCTNDTVTLYASINRSNSYQWLNNNNILSGKTENQLKLTTPGMYKVVIVNGDQSCTDTSDVIEINYLTKSFATLTPEKDTAFCNGSPFILSVDSSSLVTNIKWFRGTSTIIQNRAVAPVNNISGNYRAVVTNVYGCIDTSRTIAITVNPLPTITVPSNPSSVCGGDSLVIRANRPTAPGFIYQWSHNGNVMSNYTDTFTFAKDSGDYVLTMTSPFGCTREVYTKSIKKGEKPVIILSDTGLLNICSGKTVSIFQKDSATNRMSSYAWIINGNMSNTNKPIITRNTDGRFRLIGTNSIGCKDTSDEVQIVVNPTPAPLVIDGPYPVIVNKTYSYNVSDRSGSTYQWWVTKGSQVSGGNTNVAAIRWSSSGLGTITVVETNPFGCQGDTARTNITIENPVLFLDKSNILFGSGEGDFESVYVTSNTDWVITGDATWLGADKTNGFGEGGVTFGTLSENNTGKSRTTTVTITADNISRNIIFTQSSTVGLSELDNKSNITVYPNPTTGRFYINNTESRDITFTASDVLGKQIIQETSVKAGEKYVFNSNLSKGTYLLIIKDNESRYSTKLVITE